MYVAVFFVDVFVL